VVAFNIEHNVNVTIAVWTQHAQSGGEAYRPTLWTRARRPHKISAVSRAQTPHCALRWLLNVSTSSNVSGPCLSVGVAENWSVTLLGGARRNLSRPTLYELSNSPTVQELLIFRVLSCAGRQVQL